MLASLARIRDVDQVALSVGADKVPLTRGDYAVVEKKVALLLRWPSDCGYTTMLRFLERAES
jgi:hypothetical protein